MVKTAAKLIEPRWAKRDWVAASILFSATACVVLWQNAHVAALFDVSYILNTASRIALGQMPYRDFPLAHAPLTFLIQAAIIRLTGRVFVHSVLYVAVVGGMGTVITWRVVLAVLRERLSAAWTVALLISAPLAVLGIYCIVPNPEYDCDCGFCMLVALWMLVKLDSIASVSFGLATGVALTLPLFFKQNMGLPFLAAAIGAVFLKLLTRQRGPVRASNHASESLALFSVQAGACAALIVALLFIHWTAGIGNYLYWTISYAGQRRLPGLGLMLGVYGDSMLIWPLSSVAAALVLMGTGLGKRLWVQIVAFALLAAPFLLILASLLIYDDADERGDSLLSLWPFLLLLATALAIANLINLRRAPTICALLPLILLAAIQGTFMSQQLWGSTYGIWPLLILMMALLLVFLKGILSRQATPQWFVPALAALFSVTLLVCGGFYTASEERLSYAQMPDGPSVHSVFPQLVGLATPGPYVPEIDELLQYAQSNIPLDEGIVLIPGEEPFYFVTGRAPWFPVPFFDRTIDPYSPAETALLVKSRNIRWLVMKRDIQTKEDPTPNREATMRLLMDEFKPAAHLRGYDIYHR